MKRNVPDFDDNKSNRRIITRFINQIASGQFEIEQFDISRSDDQNEAKVKIKINGAPINIPDTDARQDRSDQGSGGTSEGTSMTPGEKKVQNQIASCYL